MAQEEIQRFTELFNIPEEIPQPEDLIYSESGQIYRLKRQETEAVHVEGDTRKLSGRTDYTGISRADIIPETAVMTVKDEESGKEFEAELSLEQVQYSNERWQDGFSFTATFHEFGADYYLFKDVKIPRQQDRPELSAYHKEFLEAAELDPEEFMIEDFTWDGEPYMDEDGVICRNVLISGRRKVWDGLAVYSAMVKMPDFLRYRMRMVYEEVTEDLDAGYLEAEPEDSNDFMDSAGPYADDKWAVLKRIIRRGLQISVGIVAIAAAVLILLRLIKAAGKAGKDEEKR